MGELINGFTGFARKESLGAFQYARDHARPDGEPAQFDPDKLRLIPDVDRRWSWTEIDLNAIRHNTSAVKQRIDNGVRLMAVVKADGYGHGAVRCAKTALNSGADYLGVATGTRYFAFTLPGAKPGDRLIGQHAGLTENEMLVSVLADRM